MAALRIESAQPTPENRVVHLVGRQQPERAVNQFLVASLFVGQAQLGAHAGLQRVRENGFVGLQCGQRVFLVFNQRQQSLAQAKQVPVGHVGLLVVGIAALVVGMVANVAGVERIEELERAVVNRQAQDAHVVGVHHAVAKPDGLPGGHQVRGAFADGLQQGRIRLFRTPAFGIKAVDDVVGQCFELCVLVAVAEVFEMAKPDETWRGARHHGCRFDFFAPHFRVRARDAQRTGRRNAQPVQGFGAQKFTNRTAQHGPAIAHARIRRLARALELDFLQSLWRFDFSQQDGPAIAQLAGPDAELMAAVHTGQWLGAGKWLVAGQGGQRFGRFQPRIAQPQFTRQCPVAPDPIGRRQGSGRQLGVEIRTQSGKGVDPFQRCLGRIEWAGGGVCGRSHR